MRRSFAVIGAVALGLVAAAVFAVVPSETSQAASSTATFVVPADNGYGIAECAASTCGKVVADQWCLAQGYAAAVEFGMIDPVETTGSIARPVRAVSSETRPFSITCTQ